MSEPLRKSVELIKTCGEENAEHQLRYLDIRRESTKLQDSQVKLGELYDKILLSAGDDYYLTRPLYKASSGLVYAELVSQKAYLNIWDDAR